MRIAPHPETDPLKILFTLVRDFVDEKNSVFRQRVRPLVEPCFHLQSEASAGRIAGKWQVRVFPVSVVVHEVQGFLVRIGRPLLQRSGPHVFAEVYVVPVFRPRVRLAVEVLVPVVARRDQSRFGIDHLDAREAAHRLGAGNRLPAPAFPAVRGDFASIGCEAVGHDMHYIHCVARRIQNDLAVLVAFRHALRVFAVRIDDLGAHERPEFVPVAQPVPYDVGNRIARRGDRPEVGDLGRDLVAVHNGVAPVREIRACVVYRRASRYRLALQPTADFPVRPVPRTALYLLRPGAMRCGEQKKTGCQAAKEEGAKGHVAWRVLAQGCGSWIRRRRLRRRGFRAGPRNTGAGFPTRRGWARRAGRSRGAMWRAGSVPRSANRRRAPYR